MTSVNAISLAALASAPPEPDSVAISGAVQPSTTLYWDKVEDENLAGYKVYFRETTSPTWDNFHEVDKNATEYTLKGIVIDNYFFIIENPKGERELGHGILRLPESLLLVDDHKM